MMEAHNDIAVGGLIDCEVVGGYNSTPGNGNGALDDMTGYRFSLCEFCLDHMFSQFRTPPKLIGYICSEEGVELEGEVFRPAEQRVREDGEWRPMRESFYKEMFLRIRRNDWTSRYTAAKKIATDP